MDAAAPPLAGVRVLDLTQVLSGPYCTQMLADLGADVIRLEGPQGDVARSMPPSAVAGDSVYFLSVNRNKRSVLIDLKQPEGAALARRLALACDVVVENFRPGVCARLGLSPAELRAEKPALVWCSISGFGQDGPYRDKPAYDLIVQALSGGMSLTGPRDGACVRAGIPVADLCAGMYAASAVAAALYRRAQTGRGETIDISMLDCQAAMLSYQAAFYLHSGRVPGRQGREHDSIATYGTFAAGDGVEVVIAALTERMWRTLCRVLGCTELADDPRFATAADRAADRAALLPLLARRFATRPADEWMAALDREGVPVGVVNTLDRVVADPQIRHRDMLLTLTGTEGRQVRVIGNPMKFAEAQRQHHSYPPAAGEHTVEVLRGVLALPEAEIERLAAAGAVTQRAAADTARVAWGGGMEFQLTGEQRMIQESARRMAERDLYPALAAEDPDRPLPKEVMRRLLQVCAAQGLTSARVPEKFGGAGMSTLTYGLMFEQLPPVVGFAIVGQEATATRIALESSDEQRERLLPDMIAARKITCTGSTEPGAGSDPRGIATRARADGDHLVIDGRKMWITNASICDVINITAVEGRNADGSGRMIRVVVDRAESPFETVKTPCLGFAQGHLGEVTFDNCRVPKRNQLGVAGDAARILTLTWLANRPLFGLMATHMAQRALDAALKYSADRSQFGRSIASYQLVQELLADISAAVTTSRLVCYYALDAIDHGERANRVSAMAKRHALAACQRAISLAMEVHGAIGISSELGLERLFRDCRMLPIPDGTNQILTLIEGRELTGISAYRPDRSAV